VAPLESRGIPELFPGRSPALIFGPGPHFLSFGSPKQGGVRPLSSGFPRAKGLPTTRLVPPRPLLSRVREGRRSTAASSSAPARRLPVRSTTPAPPTQPSAAAPGQGAAVVSPDPGASSSASSEIRIYNTTTCLPWLLPLPSGSTTASYFSDL
jgi:hypothetical protein